MTATPQPSRVGSGSPGSSRTALSRWLALGLLGILLFTHWKWFQGKVTWYLAVDQHGYFAFARDLLRGRLFHPWSPAALLGDKLWPRNDVLAQTYIFDQGHIYSRYAPGFPILIGEWLVPSAWAARGWHGGIWDPVQGGAWDPANLGRVLPLQFQALRLAYGPVLLGLIAWGAIVSCVVHRDLFLLAVPYSVASLFFFSCWVRPDARYLVGFHLFCAALLVEGVLGTLDLLRRLAGSGNLALARFLGVSFAILQLGGTLLASRLGPPLGVATWICAGVGAIAAVAATSWPQRRIARFAAPALGLALFALAMKTDYGSMGRNAGVQEPEILRAKATVEAKVPPDAVIITTEDVGRPQENLEIYADRRAIYTTDLQRWQQMRPVEAAFRLLRNGQRVFLLLPTNQPETQGVLDDLPSENVLVVELLETIPPERAKDWFVAAPFHRGVELGLWEVREKDPGVHKALSIGPVPQSSPSDAPPVP